MELRKSKACRNSPNGTFRSVTLAVGPKPGYADVKQMSLFFDLGSKDRHESVGLILDPADFEALVGAMMRVDREALIKAFAASVLAQ